MFHGNANSEEAHPLKSDVPPKPIQEAGGWADASRLDLQIIEDTLRVVNNFSETFTLIETLRHMGWDYKRIKSAKASLLWTKRHLIFETPEDFEPLLKLDVFISHGKLSHYIIAKRSQL